MRGKKNIANTTKQAKCQIIRGAIKEMLYRKLGIPSYKAAEG
jgi:hypothetical protein